MNLLRFIWRRFYIIVFLAKKHFWRSFLSSLGLLLSLIIVLMILGILRPIKKQVVKKIEGSLPAEMIRVTLPRSRTVVNPLSLFSQGQSDAVLGVGSKELSKIKGWPHIKDIYTTQILLKPALTTLEHPILQAKFGTGLSFDIMIQGISKPMIRPFLKCMKSFKVQEDDEGRPLIPFIIPETYAEILYAYSVVSGLPPIDINKLIGHKLKVRLGRSVLGVAKGEEEQVTGRICGFVPQGYVTTVGAPLPWVIRTNKSWGLNAAAKSYDQVFLRVDNFKNVGSVKKKLERLKLSYTAENRKYKGLFTWINRLDYIFWGVAIVLLALSGIALANAFMLLSIEKRYEFGLYLVFGASPIFLWAMIFIEGAFWGFLHAVLSLLLSGELFAWLQQNMAGMPMLSTLGSGTINSLSLELAASEKTYLVLGATVFAGLASLIPAMIIMGRKTLELVKKD